MAIIEDRGRIVVHVGNRTEFELSSVAPDMKRADPGELKAVLEQDVVEMRLKLIREFRIAPFPDAVDMTEWDREVLLKTWPPMFVIASSKCRDCVIGPCDIGSGIAGKCGLTAETQAAKKNLISVCRGCVGQVSTARQVVDYCLRVHGREYPVHLGKTMDSTDFTWVGVMCGFRPSDLGHLDTALAFAESQLARALLASTVGTIDTLELESQAMHAGTVLLMAQEVLETVKVSLFDYAAAANLSLADVAWFPTPIWTGRGAMDKMKKSIVFVGDYFIPMNLMVNEIRGNGLSEQYEVCGIGQAADDLPRCYERARWIGPMTRAKKILRTGIFDVIIGSEACLSFDLVSEARRSDSKLVWCGVAGLDGLEDRTGDNVDDVVNDLNSGETGVWVRDAGKAVSIALALLAGNRTRNVTIPLMDGQKAETESSRCRDDCDLCSYACPNAIQVSRGVKGVKEGKGLAAFAEIEKKCCLFGECDRACPEKIPISDIMVAAFSRKAEEDRFLFRAGRGGGQRAEMAANDFTASPGNSPGWFGIIGCGRANPDEVQWIANELASRNGIVAMAGCAAGDVAHRYDAEDRKWFMQKYPFWLQPRSAANMGGCSACQFLPTITLKNARSGAGVTHYANYVETVATTFDRYACVTIVWGPLPERMYAIVSGLVRSGLPVIVGPISSIDWERFMPGNKWDWQRYWVYETLSQKKKTVEPSPKHMLIPVETPEEAVTMASCMNIKPAQGFRMSFLEGYLDTHKQFFEELPDDWNRFVRSVGDLPVPYRVTLLSELAAKHGWKMEGMVLKQMPLPDGRVVDQRQFGKEYGAGAAPVSRIPRLCVKALHQRKA